MSRLGAIKAAGCLVRGSISQSVGMDSIHGGTMVLKSHALLSFENFEISELRWVHGLKDWSWLLACILWITAIYGPMRCS